MPDLSAKGSHQYWHDYKDPMIYRVVSFMESVENWTLDNNPKLEAAIKKLGETLEDVGNIDLQQEDQFIQLCIFIKCPRALRLMQAMDTANPGSASKLLTHAEEVKTGEDSVAGLFLRRNIVFERLRLLARVFSPQRLALVLKAFEEGDSG